MIASLLAVAITGSSASVDVYPEILNDLSKRAVRYFWEQSEPTTGLTRDRGPNQPGGKENNPEISSISATGYSLAAYAIGVKRGWLPREATLKRARATVRFILNNVEGHRGWYYHFVNWKTGKREWNSEVSSIDSGLLFAGVILADTGFADPEFSRLSKQLLAKVDWAWMMTDGGTKPKSLTFSHGWKPEQGFLEHRWGSFCEHMFLYILGYSQWPAMPTGSWNAWERPRVSYKGHDLLVGGPLFLHQMSPGFFDFKNYRDQLGFDYFVEARNATLANRAYCIENPQKFAGYSANIWGLSACDFPDGYNAHGAPGWISDNGTLAPAAAVASILFTPVESLAAAESFKSQFPDSYGQYGFATGINPAKKWTAPDVIGIDLGQLLLMIEIHRDGLPHQWMMSRPEVNAAYQKIGLKLTAEKPGITRPLQILP